MKQSATHAIQATETTQATSNATKNATTNSTASKQEGRINYDPNHLLDTLMQHLGIDNDGALSRRLKIARDVIGNIRRGTVPVCASMLLWMQEATGIDVAELRRLLGDRRAKFRLHISIRQQPAPV